MHGHLFKSELPGTARIFVLLLILQIPLAARGRNTPDPGGTATGKKAENADYSPQDIYYLGRAVAANIVSRYRPYKQNRRLSDYLNNICSALIVNSPASVPAIYNGYHVMVLDSEDISLMLELDQVARQSGQKAARIRPVPERLGSLQESVRAMTDALFINGYSQRQEFEADIYALSLLRSAGYQPSALVELLQALHQSQTGSRSSFYSTHPLPSRRINNIQSRLGGQSADTGSFRKNRFQEMSR
jgi:predicted Zn-dependent protease